MPFTLKFPIKKVKPELTLSNILSNATVTNFGGFSIWYAQIVVGLKNQWIKHPTRSKIDTGASISLFPEAWATDLNLSDGIEYEFYGVYRKDDCLLPVTLRQIDLKIYDGYGTEGLLKNIWVAFTKVEEAPILLGVKDVLENMNFSFNKEKNEMILQSV